MTPSGLEPTPARGYPFLRACPHCGKPLPPVAQPVGTHAALVAKTTVNRAAELEDATPTHVEMNPRLAETDRLETKRPGG